MKREAEPAPDRLLPDSDARGAIREDLLTTILVEAAAGTGKTSELVERMVALIATGTQRVENLSAVTFTIKAAAQLRQKLQNALEETLRKEAHALRRGRLSEALDRLDSCFVGTIHAFCARLLRERPVEAGVDPDFEEMDEPEDSFERDQAWDRFTQALFLRGDLRLQRLIDLGVHLGELRPAYEALCQNSDVQAAIGAEPPEPDFGDARRQLRAFLDAAAPSIPAQVPEGGWDRFQAAMRRASRLWALLDVSRSRDFAEILSVLRPHGVAEDAGTSWRRPFQSLRENVIKPALTAWAEHLHPTVMSLLAEARVEYARWRRQSGRLNFQDLLLLSRAMLRERPAVREALRGRFTPILVDEFQDTDPIQAEILFYLTGKDTAEKDWRKLVPIPGSLFVVGDPKQSIYRFRRADIETYETVRERIALSGRVLELSSNFRSTPGICDWVNRVFGSRFPARPTREQAAWVPLSPARMGREGEPATFRIETVRPGRSREPVAREDARRVADAIAATVRAGERDPGDFLVLFRRRKFMDIYAAELERRGIACEIAGGGAFGESEELADLMPLLEALADPDNPVPLVAALRGPLFGVDDEALYRFARAHGRFHFRSEPPPETDPRIRRAFELLRQAETLVETLPPAAAISRLVDRLGVTALAAAKELGDSRAGNLLKALAAARKFSAQGSSFAGVVRELQGLRAQELIEQMSVEPGRAGAVRLMTLHGAKGLEAPVVFLADPTSDPGKPRDYWIDRARDEGHFRVAKRFGEFGEQDIALPQGWADRKEKEKLFDEAEKVRLLYVGATRAKEALVVSIWRTATGRKASGSWAVLDPYLDRDLPRPALSAEAEARPPTPRLADALEASRRLRAQRRDRSGAATRAAATVTDLAHGEAGRPAWERRGRGMSWGRAVHRLLEGAMRDETLDLGAYAANLLAEEERPEVEREEIARLADAVRRSPLWERARKARRRLPEVPFALEVAREELGLAEGPERVLLHGAIDLAFEEEDGWVLIDYKSDAVTPENLEGLVAFYSPQVTLYRRNWEKLTGRPAKAALFFLDGSREVWLPQQAAAAGVGR